MVRTRPFQGCDRSPILLEGTILLGGWLSGRAPPSHGGGRRFEPCSAHHVLLQCSQRQSCAFVATGTLDGHLTYCRITYTKSCTGSWCSWSNTLACHAGDHGFKSRRSRQSGSSSGVERCLAKAVVAGPNPVFRSILFCSGHVP